MPIHNGETTLTEIFASLEIQHNKGLIHEIIFIDDASNDGSASLLTTYQSTTHYANQLI